MSFDIWVSSNTASVRIEGVVIFRLRSCDVNDDDDLFYY